MSDIVERLREAIGKMAVGLKSPSSRDLNSCLDAADEILNLRIELHAKETEALGYLRAVRELQARCTKLEKALEPFASVAHAILAEAPPSAGNVEIFTDCEGNIYRISLDDVRGICAALRAAHAEESNG